MKLSIVIISWNSRLMLERCLLALRSVLERPDVELVWVDNGSVDGSDAVVKRHAPDAIRLRLPRNCGVAFARNRGVSLASGEYVLFLDDDTEANAEAIRTMESALDSDPELALTAVALRDRDGYLQDSFKPYPGLGVKIRNVLGGLLRIKRRAQLPGSTIEPFYVIGACQMFRRRAFMAVGGLDENIFYGPEDADFCIRLREKGWRISYIPSASIVHHWRRSTTVRPFSDAGRRHIQALLYFYRKHRRYL